MILIIFVLKLSILINAYDKKRAITQSALPKFSGNPVPIYVGRDQCLIDQNDVWIGSVNLSVSGEPCQYSPRHHNNYCVSTNYDVKFLHPVTNRSTFDELRKIAENEEKGNYQNVQAVACNSNDKERDGQFCNVCKNSWLAYNACTLPKYGQLYRGQLSKALTGRECMNWQDVEVKVVLHPDRYEYINVKFLPDSIRNSRNFCRNPTPWSREGPWCYLKNPPEKDTVWQYCDVCTDVQISVHTDKEINVDPQKASRNFLHFSSCDVMCASLKGCSKFAYLDGKCFLNPTGVGPKKATVHVQKKIFVEVIEDWVEMAYRGARKYSMETFIQFFTAMGGRTYSGSLNVSASGEVCQPWVFYKKPWNYGPFQFPEQSISGAENYCRAPLAFYGTPFCHTRKGARACDVTVMFTREYRACHLKRNGYFYMGNKAVTITGRSCMKWVDAARASAYQPELYQKIANHAFSGVRSSRTDALNYCRNPTPMTRFGPWCFIHAYENGTFIHSWEYCDVCTVVRPVQGFRPVYAEVVLGQFFRYRFTVRSFYECQYICSTQAMCSAVIFEDMWCGVEWRDVLARIEKYTFQAGVYHYKMMVYDKPCMELRHRTAGTEAPRALLIKHHWCFRCMALNKENIFFMAKKKVSSCLKNCLRNPNCIHFRFDKTTSLCRIFNGLLDVCECVAFQGEEVYYAVRCPFYVSADKKGFEIDTNEERFGPNNYEVSNKEEEEMEWEVEDEDGSKEEEELERAKMTKVLGDIDNEGMSPVVIGELLQVLLVTWTFLTFFLTVFACCSYVDYL